MNKIKDILLQPFPLDHDNKRNFFSAIAISIFVVLFIFIFRIAGGNSPYNVFRILGFGLITFIVLITNVIIIPYLIPSVFQDEKWNLLKAILYQTFILSMISFGNLLYANIICYLELSLLNFINEQIIVFSIAIFPITFIFLRRQNALLRKYSEGADKLNKSIQNNQFLPSDSHEMLSLSSENGKEQVEIGINNLLFIKSVENYAEIHWKDELGFKKALLRSSLKRIEESVTDYPILFRCHRAFLVNTNNIERVISNSQGYRLFFKDISDSIPVSRNASKKFATLIEKDGKPNII